VALSEHEQKLLAEMEAALAADDPRLVGALSGKARTRQASRVLTGALAVLVGLAVIIAGLIAKTTIVGIIGFIIALSGAFTAISNFSLRQMMGKNIGTSARKSARWSDRLERRWDDRNNNQ
jgi:Protein of unknown function (DUF3040)